MGGVIFGGRKGIDLEIVTSRLIFAAMSKKNIIEIDLNVWTTQTAKAKSMGLNESTVRQRVLRTKNGTAKPENKEVYWDIPELSLTLVKKP